MSSVTSLSNPLMGDYEKFLLHQRNFYSDMFSTQGQSLSATIQVKPFSSVSQFSCTANSATGKQVFFDIGNTASMPIVQPKDKVYYHGRLRTQVYVSVTGGQTDSQFQLNLLTNGANTYFPVKYRTGPSCGSIDFLWNYSTGQWTYDQFEDVLFSFLQLDVFPGATGNLSIVCKTSFTGFQITY